MNSSWEVVVRGLLQADARRPRGENTIISSSNHPTKGRPLASHSRLNPVRSWLCSRETEREAVPPWNWEEEEKEEEEGGWECK